MCATVLFVLCFLFSPATGGEIHTAATAGDIPVLTRLVAENPSIVNSLDEGGSGPIHLAALGGHLEAVLLLVENGADVTLGDGDNTSPLTCAAMRGHLEVARYLLDNGAPAAGRDNFGNMPILSAAASGNFELMQLLLDRGAAVDVADNRGSTALHKAVFRGSPDLVEFLINNGADLNALDSDGNSPLIMACYGGRVDIIDALVAQGADVNSVPTDNQFSPLGAAAWRGNIDAARHLIELGADIKYRQERTGETALHLAAMRGHIEVAEFLMEQGLDVNITDKWGATPLFGAAWQNPEMVRWLLAHGAEVELQTDSIGSPLTRSIYGGNAECLQLLIDAGAEVNTSAVGGDRPLKTAVERGNVELARLLVEAGAEVDFVDERTGSTPLHLCCATGQSEMVRLLVQNGANVNREDSDGRTPLYYAVHYANRPAAEILRFAGGALGVPVDEAQPTDWLTAPIDAREAAVWYLNHSGWAVKTAHHLLIFDYYLPGANPDEPALANGRIDPNEIKDENVLVFSSHEHSDHYDTTIFGWQETIPNITYIFGHQPRGRTGFQYTAPRTDNAFGDVRVRTITATDAGVGFIVEVDGLVIYHAGDHANGVTGLNAVYTDEIDYIAGFNVPIDLAFIPISGCSLGTPESVREGVLYALDKLHPAVFFPQHAGNSESRYREFAESLVEDGYKVATGCAGHGGDCFRYSNGKVM
jgi:ankyrin repeat protein/L-ascorbate metabolism protein UlaG (beta-lactamase superfamily)